MSQSFNFQPSNPQSRRPGQLSSVYADSYVATSTDSLLRRSKILDAQVIYAGSPGSTRSLNSTPLPRLDISLDNLSMSSRSLGKRNPPVKHRPASSQSFTNHSPRSENGVKRSSRSSYDEVIRSAQQSKTTTLRNEIATLSERVAELKRANQEEATITAHKLERASLVVQEALALKMLSDEKYEAEIETLRSHMAGANNHRQEAKNEFEKTKRDLSEALATSKRHQDWNNEMETRCRETEQKYQALSTRSQSEIEQLQRELSNARLLHREDVARYSRENAAQQDAIRNLTNQLSENNSLLKELKQREEETKGTLQARVLDLQSRLESTNKKSTDDVANLRSVLTIRDETIDRLKEEKHKSLAESAELRKQIDSNATARSVLVQQHEQEVLKLKKQHEDTVLKQADATRQLADTITELRKTIAANEEKLIAAAKANAATERLLQDEKQKVADITRAHKEAEAQIKALKETIALREKQCKESTDESILLRRKLNDLEDEIEIKAAALSAAKRRAEAAEKSKSEIMSPSSRVFRSMSFRNALELEDAFIQGDANQLWRGGLISPSSMTGTPHAMKGEP